MPPSTQPHTFTAEEVRRIFRGAIQESTLQYWDKKHLLRPSFYSDTADLAHLMSPAQRDAFVAQNRVTQGRGPRRRYTYTDLVWIRLFVYIRKCVGRRAGQVLGRLRLLCDSSAPPSAARLLFHGRHVYLLRDDEVAECLTRPGELAMTQLLTDQVEAEVWGRVKVLAAHRQIRQVAEPVRGVVDGSADGRETVS